MKCINEPTTQAVLVKLAQMGNRKAFEKLIRPYLEKIYQAAYYLIEDKDDAADLAQETFIRAFSAIDRFREDAPLSPWLHRILRNLYYDHCKRGTTRFEIRLDDKTNLFNLITDNNSPLDKVLLFEYRQFLSNSITELPAEFKEVLVLCDIQEMSYNQAAEICDLPLGTIKSRLNRARLLLRKKIVESENLHPTQINTQLIRECGIS